jgi:peroxiredoxin (alkyl hydroperoxide reductase subunit C)
MSDYKALMIGEKAPNFKANTTYGMINFPEDYKGKWVIFFSHPGDLPPYQIAETLQE